MSNKKWHYANERAQHWLAIYNEYVEAGKEHLKACDVAYRKATHWLDRLNRLEGKV